MRFDLTGYNIDNLLRTLYNKKIVIFNLNRVEHNKVSFSCFDKDAKKVKRYIHNFKVKTTLSKFKQIPRFLKLNVGIILGVFFGLIIGIFLSNYTWQIKVYGTENLSEENIINLLKENNIRVGKINRQTSEEIEYLLLNNYDILAQVSVIKRGTAIVINLSEKLVYVEEEYSPITAKFSGIITEINLVTGTTNVKVGDYVNVGDILVLPFNVNTNGEQVSVKPMAEIKANIFITHTEKLNREEVVLVRSGKEITTYSYKLKNLNLFSGKNKNSFALFETVSYNEYISGLIPLNRDVVTYYELTPTIKYNDFSLERENLIEKSRINALEKLPSTCEQIDVKSEVSVLDETMYAITTITATGVINDWI